MTTMQDTDQPMNNPEFYFCYIGPIDRDKLDISHPSGEGHLRESLKDAFHDVAGHWADRCGSGWGIKPECIDAMMFGERNEELKKAIVLSYIDEKIPMPRHIKAWYLLLKDENSL